MQDALNNHPEIINVMKSYIKIISVLSISMILLLPACINYNFDEPEKATYNPNIEATSTIQELKNLYTGDLTLLDTNVVIKGTVIANDKSGNIYKAIYIQDSTAGIQISLNAYELHNRYHVGDLIYVKCQGLYLGEYGGQIQLGSDYQGAVGRIEEPLIKFHLFKSDGGIPIVPKELNIATPNGSLVNKLVIIHNAQFKFSEVSGTYADGVNHIDYDRHLEDCDGNSIIVRTSGYADFANDSLPKGNGTIIAVLTKYKSDYQLIIRNPREVNMNNARCGALFSEDFDNGLGQFKTFNVLGSNNTWFQSAYGNTTYAKMTGYYTKAYEASEDWLVSNSIDLNGISGAVLNFTHVVRYSPNWNDIKVLISTNYDGISDPSTNGTWTELTGWAHTSGNDWTFVDSGDINISAYTGSKVHIAFKYTSPSNDASTWEIDKVSVSIQ